MRVVVVMDVWDRHWCLSVNNKLPRLVRNLGSRLEVFRQRGWIVAWAPSYVVSRFDVHPARLKIPDDVRRQLVTTPANDAPWANDERCACETPCVPEVVQTNMNTFTVLPEDFVVDPDHGGEVRYLANKFGASLLYTGMAVNKCLLYRNGGMQALTEQGVSCTLSENLSLVEYPYPVTQEEARERVYAHVRDRYVVE